MFGDDHPNTKKAVNLFKKCTKKVAQLADVESAMLLIDVSLVPLASLLKAKQSVFESLSGM